MPKIVNGKPVIMTCHKKQSRDPKLDAKRFADLVEHHNEYYADNKRWGVEEDVEGIYIVEEENGQPETD